MCKWLPFDQTKVKTYDENLAPFGMQIYVKNDHLLCFITQALQKL
jgi:hypothetical protein